MPSANSKVFSSEDAHRIAKRRLPRLVFDFIEGAAGREKGTIRNQSSFDQTLLQPRVLGDVSTRKISTDFLGQVFDTPYGIAPMGMCNLVRPHADQVMADLAHKNNFPVCVSSAASSTIEDMSKWADKNTWFQLYFGASKKATMASVERAANAGIETLVLTADVPQVSRRIRDLRNDFKMPFRMTPRAFWDFATHPVWSLQTLYAGIPSPKNFAGSVDEITKFDRDASRSGADWNFLQELRDAWSGKLIVKGVTDTDDARRIKALGVDAIYVSNHGARQLDSAPAALNILPKIRDAVGPSFPLLFDSGARNGEDIVKALAKGADFVMLGRPILYSLGADGARGLNAYLEFLNTDISVAMAQIGCRTTKEINKDCIVDHSEPT